MLNFCLSLHVLYFFEDESSGKFNDAKLTTIF